MLKKVLIDVDSDNYVISGKIDDLTKNKRLWMMMKSLFSAQKEDEYLILPIENKAKKHQLQELIGFFERFGFDIETSQKVKSKEDAFERERNFFLQFSEQARKIRNDEFSSEPELIKKFEEFRNIINHNMIRTLYPLQLLSAFHMAFAQYSCNFAVPGAGKTSIVYAAYIYLKSLPINNPKHVNKLMVIGPLSSFAPWENEYFACFNQNIESQRMSGDITISRLDKESHLYSAAPKELTLISHAGIPLLEKEIIDFLKKNKVMVVVDEAHRIKNANGVWGSSVVEIAKEASARVILTGTPVPNGYEDLYNLFRFLYPFKYQEVLQIHYDQLKEMTKNSILENDERVETFIKNINPYFIRIKKNDLKLPGAQDHIIEVAMDQHQRMIYEFIEEKYIKTFYDNPVASIKDILNRAKLIRLRQASINPSLLLKSLQDSLEHSEDGMDSNYEFSQINNESIDDVSIFKKIVDYEKSCIPQKFIKLQELLKEKIFPQNGKVIIWTIFIQNAEQLQDYLAKNNILSELLIGRIPQSEREIIIEKFNNPENLEFQVVIANPFSVSESISLHKGCHNAVYLERDYNAANFLQSKDRIHRVGLAKNVETNYYYLISKDSIDSVINEKLNIKVNRMEKIIDDDIPLFNRLNDFDETDIIKALLDDYAKRT